MRRSDLRPDCGACAALCCVHLSFERSLAFGFDKRAGEACPNLTSCGRCRIHAELAPRGFSGCVAFDCHGAGPRATRAFGGRADAFAVLRALHEQLWLLTEAAKLLPPSQPAALAEVSAAVAALDAVAEGPLDALLATDLGPLLAASKHALRQVGAVLGNRGQQRPAAAV